MTPSMKTVFIVAGPNGAGKTSFALEYLPNEASCLTFINADLIAAGISPFRPEPAAIRAGRVMLHLISEYVTRGESFAFETTLSGRTYANMIPRWQQQGYWVKLFFLRLPNPELAIDRVRHRVHEGGHNVPESIVRRRFDSGWRNFETIYRNLVDEWAVYDNSGETPILLEEGSRS